MTMMMLLSQVLELYQTGVTPTSEEATSVGLLLFGMVADITMKATENMTEEDRLKLHLFEADEVELDPAVFPSILSDEEMEYISKLMEHVDPIYHAQKEQCNGSTVIIDINKGKLKF